MIVLDLEWNCGYDKTPLDEILQIGAVRLDRLGGRIVDTFSIYIRPQVHKRLNRMAKALPEIQSSLSSVLDFPTAYQQFLSWCGDDREFAAWGADDFDTLEKNTTYWKLPPLVPQTVCDLQTAFSLTLGTMQNIALWWAVEYCQIPQCFTYHNALNDAMYTALCSAWIDPDFLELAARPRWTLRYLLDPYPAAPEQPTGVFPTLSAALNGRSSRKSTCPICHSHISVQSWSYREKGTYYANLRCPKHGYFITRLTLSPLPDGRWQGRREIPAPTPAFLDEFGRARQGRQHLCMGGTRGRHRYRKKRKDKKHG